MICKDSHLSVSGAGLFVDVELALASGIKKLAAWAEVTFHINQRLARKRNGYTKGWTKALIDRSIEIKQLPYSLHLDLTVAGVGFQAGLKAVVDDLDLVTSLATCREVLSILQMLKAVFND